MLVPLAGSRADGAARDPFDEGLRGLQERLCGSGQPYALRSLRLGCGAPSTREENLRKLGHALEDLNARRVDGKPLALEEGLPNEPVLELETDVDELKVVPEPAGTRGYDDLRRDASREPLGSGLRPSVASLGDHARMLAALAREQDLARLRTLRRVIDLERQFGLGLER